MKEEKFRLKINPGLALISLPATAPLGAFLFDIANEMIILHLISFPQFQYDLIYFIYIYQIHLFHENKWTYNWWALSVSGFIAQLFRASHQYREARAQTPLKPWIFSGSLRNCINCVHNSTSFPGFLSYPSLSLRRDG